MCETPKPFLVRHQSLWFMHDTCLFVFCLFSLREQIWIYVLNILTLIFSSSTMLVQWQSKCSFHFYREVGLADKSSKHLKASSFTSNKNLEYCVTIQIHILSFFLMNSSFLNVLNRCFQPSLRYFKPICQVSDHWRFTGIIEIDASWLYQELG